MKTTKRFLSIFLAVAMMLTLAPAAFAADTTVTTEEQLTSALSNAAAGDTITLGADITLSNSLNFDKAVTLDGANHALTAGSFSAVKVTASGVTIENVNIGTAGHGINFDATGLTGNPTLVVTNTTIRNTNVSNYNVSADYGADNRGISTYNVRNGQIDVAGCSIFGFKYSINPVVDAVGGLRDGAGTIFNVTNTTIKGWTALNMWSANTVYNFKNCTLTGINALNSGSANNFSTIVANDGIYGAYTDGSKSSVVNITGGTVQAVQLNSCAEAAFNVDNQFQTKFNFYKNFLAPVNVEVYYPDNVTNDVGIWNFYWLYSNDAQRRDKYFAEMVTGLKKNITGTFLPSSEWEEQAGLALYPVDVSSDNHDVLTALTGVEDHVGGGVK